MEIPGYRRGGAIVASASPASYVYLESYNTNARFGGAVKGTDQIKSALTETATKLAIEGGKHGLAQLVGLAKDATKSGVTALKNRFRKRSGRPTIGSGGKKKKVEFEEDEYSDEGDESDYTPAPGRSVITF